MSRSPHQNAKLPRLRACVAGLNLQRSREHNGVARVIFDVISDTVFATESIKLRPVPDNVVSCRIG
jgi:hypothetical protein